MTNRFRIYVAASGAEVDRARQAMAWLRERGHEIVGDWTDAIATQGRHGETMSDCARSDASVAQLVAVTQSDGLLLLVPPNSAPSVGAWVELGTAYGAGLPIVASYPGPRLPFMAAWALHSPADDVAAARLVSLVGQFTRGIGGRR